MSPRVAAVNRLVLTVLGLLLLAGGVLGLVLGSGGFGPDRAGSPLVPDTARTFAAEQPWLWWAVAAGSLLLALLSLLWLLAQARTDRVGRLDLTTDDTDGLTTLHAGAVTDAVETEAEALRGVTGAHAVLRDRHGRRLQLAVDLADHADLAEVRHALEDRTVAHVRQALDTPDLPVDIQLRPSRARTRTGGRGLR